MTIQDRTWQDENAYWQQYEAMKDKNYLDFSKAPKHIKRQFENLVKKWTITEDFKCK